MKQRIISAVVGLVVLFTVFALFNTPLLNLCVAAIVVMAFDELITTAGYSKNNSFFYLALLFCAAIPFFETSLIDSILPAICFLFALILLCLILRHHNTLNIEQMSFTFFFAFLLSLSFTCLVYLRDVFGVTIGLYGVIVALGGAWLSDAGAYFFGIAFGKRKLAPSISPKKTVEGAIGGVGTALVGQLLLAWLYTRYCGMLGIDVAIDYVLLGVLSPFISVLSILGDLSASVLKRHFRAKDFGKLMPGHGGVLDRFDSVVLLSPFVYNLFLYRPIIRVL